jgi:hypothetical protein
VIVVTKSRVELLVLDLTEGEDEVVIYIDDPRGRDG